MSLPIVCFSSVLGAQTPQNIYNYGRGLEAFKSKDYESCVNLMAAAEESRPGGTTDALLYRGKALIDLKRFQEAEQSLRTYRGFHPESAETLFLLGYVLFAENRPNESLESYTGAARLQKPRADDLKIVGLDYVPLNDYEDAATWLQRAVEFDPGNLDAWYSLGRVRYTQNLFSPARNAFEHALALDPHDVKAESNLGLLYEAENHPEDAIAAYRNAIQWQASALHPSEQPFLNLGVLLLTRGELGEALRVLEEALRVAPLNPSAHGQVGRAYLQLNQVVKACKEFQTATRLEPGNASWHYQLGRTYRRLGQTEQAKAEFATFSRLLANKSLR